jgi:hypothetical protein
MTAFRRKALLLALTAAIVVGGAGSTASASFADTATVTTAVSTGTVAPPTNVVGKLVCTSPDATMSATWTTSPSARITSQVVKVTFSDGFVQEKSVPVGATSWSAPISKYNATLWAIQFSVVAKTDYGWFAESVKTGWFQC